MPFKAFNGAQDGRPFQKGKSANPGGRPKIEREIVDLARANSVEAINTLVGIMRSSDAKPNERAVAANAILDRAFGKPKQSVQVDDRRSLRDLTDDELIAIARGTGAAGETTGTDEPSRLH